MEMNPSTVRRKPFVCECGDPPVKVNSCREPVCLRCSKLENTREVYVKKGAKSEYDLGGVKGNKHWDKIWGDDTPVLWPDAIARLDSMLKAVELDAANKCQQVLTSQMG